MCVGLLKAAMALAIRNTFEAHGGEQTEMAGNPWVRDNRAFQRLEPSHATVCTQASDQSARDPRYVHCLGLNQLRNRS